MIPFSPYDVFWIGSDRGQFGPTAEPIRVESIRGVENHMASLKCLIVYHSDGRWFGSEVEWVRSGSGYYRNIVGIPIPQSRPEIADFAAENGYKIEWRGPTPEAQSASV